MRIKEFEIINKKTNESTTVYGFLDLTSRLNMTAYMAKEIISNRVKSKEYAIVDLGFKGEKNPKPVKFKPNLSKDVLLEDYLEKLEKLYENRKDMAVEDFCHEKDILLYKIRCIQSRMKKKQLNYL